MALFQNLNLSLEGVLLTGGLTEIQMQIHGWNGTDGGGRGRLFLTLTFDQHGKAKIRNNRMIDVLKLMGLNCVIYFT